VSQKSFGGYGEYWPELDGNFTFCQKHDEIFDSCGFFNKLKLVGGRYKSSYDIDASLNQNYRLPI
jgi:hypothetical protein